MKKERIKKIKKPVLSRFQLFTENIVDKMMEVLELLLKVFKKPSGQILLRISCKVLLALIFVWLLVIPFKILTFLGQWSFLFAANSFTPYLIHFWKYVMNFSYIIVAMLSLYLIIEKTILNEPIFIDLKINKKKKNESIEGQSIGHLLFQPVAILLRMVTIILTIPLILILLSFAFLLGIFLTLIFSGSFPFGIFFLLVGFILMTGSVLGMIYHLTFKGDEV